MKYLSISLSPFGACPTLSCHNPLLPASSPQHEYQPPAASTTTTATTVKTNMPASMILNYFQLPGRGEATRVALAYAGKEFEDNMMSFEEYGACKWMGKGLPVLEVDEIVMLGEDIMGKIFSCLGEKDDTVAKGLLAGKVKTLLEVLVGKVEASSSKFCVGDSLTIADLQVHALIANVEADFLTGIPTTLIKDTAAPLMAVKAAVMEDPKVKAYYSSKK